MNIQQRDVPFRHATVVASKEHIPPDDSLNIYIPTSSIIRQRPPLNDDAHSMRSFHFSMTSLDAQSTFPQTLANTNNSIVRTHDDDAEIPLIESVWSEPEHTIPGLSPISKCLLLNNKRHALTQCADGLIELWDLIRCSKVKSIGVFRNDEKIFLEIYEKLNTFEWISNWCNVDFKNGFLTVHLEESRCFDAEFYHEDSGSGVLPSHEDQRGMKDILS